MYSARLIMGHKLLMSNSSHVMLVVYTNWTGNMMDLGQSPNQLSSTEVKAELILMLTFFEIGEQTLLLCNVFLFKYLLCLLALNHQSTTQSLS